VILYVHLLINLVIWSNTGFTLPFFHAIITLLMRIYRPHIKWLQVNTHSSREKTTRIQTQYRGGLNT